MVDGSDCVLFGVSIVSRPVVGTLGACKNRGRSPLSIAIVRVAERLCDRIILLFTSDLWMISSRLRAVDFDRLPPPTLPGAEGVAEHIFIIGVNYNE